MSDFDWPVIFLSIACIGNSVGVICLSRAVWILQRNQRALRWEILCVKGCQESPIDAEEVG